MAKYISCAYPIGIIHANLLNYLHTIMQNIWFETMRYVPHTFKKYLKLSWSIIYINIGCVYLFLFIFFVSYRVKHLVSKQSKCLSIKEVKKDTYTVRSKKNRWLAILISEIGVPLSGDNIVWKHCDIFH